MADQSKPDAPPRPSMPCAHVGCLLRAQETGRAVCVAPDAPPEAPSAREWLRQQYGPLVDSGSVTVDGMLVHMEAFAAHREAASQQRIEWLQEREAYFARVLGVADGGQYRADWDGAIRRVLKRAAATQRERDEFAAENQKLRVSITQAQQAIAERNQVIAESSLRIKELERAWSELVAEDATAFKSAGGGPANRNERFTPDNLRHVVRSRKMEASHCRHQWEVANQQLLAKEAKIADQTGYITMATTAAEALKVEREAAESRAEQLTEALRSIVNWYRHPGHGGKYGLPKAFEAYIRMAERALADPAPSKESK